jgi:Na+-transporting NADH:ubiquinone oxidoreductase subunit A
MHITIKKGLELPLAGRPEQAVFGASPVRSAALLADDYHGVKPDLNVAEGDRVIRGQTLFEDSNNPGVPFTAPACGTVAAIHRGARRRLQSIVIRVEGDEQCSFTCWPRSALNDLEGSTIREQLLASGLWTAFRTRPFSGVPAPESTPNAIFITAIDTNPLAADPNVVIRACLDAFSDGVRLISKLTGGRVYVCVGSGITNSLPQIDGIHVVTFRGPHPAGLVGTHVHFLNPVHSRGSVWHLNYQDVIAIGKLFTTGRLDLNRVVSLAGPRVRKPRLIRAPVGASIDDLVAGELREGSCRVVSGSILSGRRAAGPNAFLGRYHLQVCALEETSQREFLGWLAPGRRKFSATRMFASSLFRRRPIEMTTSQHGSPRAMVPIGSYERVMPLDVLITPLLKALLINDTETARELGCLELDEEDLALCAFVCCSKYEFGEALRDTLTVIETNG